MSTLVEHKQEAFKEQYALFSEDDLYPEYLPRAGQLQPSFNLSAIFDECHNYIYANEGLLKQKIFHEIVKLLIVKLFDEHNANKNEMRFGITSSEFRDIFHDRPSTFLARLNELYGVVQKSYIFLFSDESLNLKPLTLAYVVGRLQFISLTKTPCDIKGEAFQVFIDRHQRGDRGEFFTPHPIVKLAVKMMSPKPHERVIDPACGSGGFLIQTIAHVCGNYPEIDKPSYIKEHVYGIEFNPDIALSAMIRIAFEGGSSTEILCTNALNDNEKMNNSFDIVLTNPPFGSKGKVEDQKILKSYILARKWSKVTNCEWVANRNVLAAQSPEILFIEKCLKLLRSGGRMAIVLPDGILQNISNDHIRFWFRARVKVLGVVSIPQEAFVPYGTGIKTSLLLLQKLPSGASHVFLGKIEKLGYDVKGRPIYKRDERSRFVKAPSGLNIIDDDVEDVVTAYRKYEGGDFDISGNKIYIVPEKLLNSRLDVEHYQPEDRKLLEYLKRGGARPLGELADILGETDNFRLESDGEIRYIAISDVDSRTMQVVSQQVIKSVDAPSRATYRVKEGDIITAISGASTGTQRHATALITADEAYAICSNGFAVLRDFHGVNSLFLLAYMRTEYFLRQVKRLMTGHAIPAISTEDLSKVLVALPPKVEQEKIAKAISTIQLMRKEALKMGEKIAGETATVVNSVLLTPA